MQVFSNIIDDSKYSLIFIHGWGGNEKSLECLEKQFQTKYSCFRLCLSGFGNDLLEKEYKVKNYLEEIEVFINTYKIKNIVLIGHSFGGKIAYKLKLKHPEYIVIGLAPSIVRNPFSIKIFLKIKLYKLCKKLHIPIINSLRGSKDYQNSSSYLRRTFLNVHHDYLTKKELNNIDKGLIIGFKKDKEVNYKVLKKVCRKNNIKFILIDGDHFAYIGALLEIYHIINCFLRDYNG